MKRMRWGYPVKSLKKAQRKLQRDLKFYGGTGIGNCAQLDERNPKIVSKRRKDSSTWYYIEVDDILLDLELDE